MRLSPLEKVQHKIKLGQPLPFSIRDGGGRLLLARGHVLGDQDQMDAVLDRGAFVDIDEVMGPRAEILQAPPEKLPALWRGYAERVASCLHAAPGPQWVQNIEEAARIGLTLVDRLPDLAIFMIVRGDAPQQLHYGVMHSVHAAATSALIARRLAWDDARTLTLMRAALTMNLSIVDLQGRLAAQEQAPNALQRTAIRQHPDKSVAMLRAVGVTDADWLVAVAQHHETPDGKGYPQGLTAIHELGEVLRVADVFTAKLSARASRAAMAANQAAKQLFTSQAGSAHCAAVVKEFGIYPPGCFVSLQSGEIGIVARRGANAGTPLVDALISRNGERLLQPVRRDSSHRGFGIVQTVPDAKVMVRVAPEKLFADRLH